jgi:hypothetical protein
MVNLELTAKHWSCGLAYLTPRRLYFQRLILKGVRFGFAWFATTLYVLRRCKGERERRKELLLRLVSKCLLEGTKASTAIKRHMGLPHTAPAVTLAVNVV